VPSATWHNRLMVPSAHLAQPSDGVVLLSAKLTEQCSDVISMSHFLTVRVT